MIERLIAKPMPSPAGGVYALQQQIQEHLLQLDAIGQHRGESGRQVGVQGHPVAAQLAVGRGVTLQINWAHGHF
jgi:hypothetical protein